MKRLALALTLALAPLPALAEQAPWQMVRALEALQNKAAAAGLDTRREERAQSRRIAAAFDDADPAVWSDPRNARAALVYVLAGGQPRILVAFGTFDSPPPVEPKLVAAVVAHVSGRSAVARELFDAVDPDSLPATLAAHVTLAHATLLLTEDPARAQRLLARARLLMPGTLVAEAAARREVTALARLHRRDAFVSLVHRYIRTWGDSIYAGDLSGELPVLWFQLNAKDLHRTTDGLEALAAGLPPTTAADLYIDITRRSLIAGEMALAADVARSAAGTVIDEPVRAARAAIYGAAANVASSDFSAPVQTLREIDVSGLDRTDRAIRLSALFVARQVFEEAAADAPPAAGDADAQPAANAVAERAVTMLEEIDILLSEEAS